MQVIKYNSKYKKQFIEFNKEWILKYFGKMEKDDFDTFNNIDEIISDGGMIFFAVDGDDVLSTCMVKPMQNGSWEICKLAANTKIPRKGAGTAVFEESVKWAKDHGAKKIEMLSNTKLAAAIHIYKKHGFKEVPIFDNDYERVDIAFELDLT